MHKLILSHGQTTIDEVANRFQTHRLAFHKVFENWIPKQLTKEHIWEPVDINRQNLNTIESRSFLEEHVMEISSVVSQEKAQNSIITFSKANTGVCDLKQTERRCVQQHAHAHTAVNTIDTFKYSRVGAYAV